MPVVAERGARVRLDLATQVLALDVGSDTGQVSRRLRVGELGGFVSASMLAFKARRVAARVMAAVGAVATPARGARGDARSLRATLETLGRAAQGAWEESAAVAARIERRGAYGHLLARTLGGSTAPEPARPLGMSSEEGYELPQDAVIVRPSLTVEPVPAYYAGRAAACRAAMAALDGAVAAASDPSVREALAAARREIAAVGLLLAGACVTSLRELGVEPGPGTTGDAGFDAGAAQGAFTAWAGAVADDADLQGDCRGIDPLERASARRGERVRVTLGWARRDLWVSFVTPPRRIRGLGEIARSWLQGRGRPLVFEGTHRSLACLVEAALAIDPGTRDTEIRRRCGRLRTAAAIERRIESGGPGVSARGRRAPSTRG